MKLALGTAVDASHADLQEGMGPEPYGGGRKGGSHLEVEQSRAAAAERPDKALVSLGVANAFGSVKWTDALAAVLGRARSLAPALAAQRAPELQPVEALSLPDRRGVFLAGPEKVKHVRKGPEVEQEVGRRTR